MQASAQKWERLLYAMGGALNHVKCFWYGINWMFNANGGCTMNEMTVPDDPEIKLMAGDDLTTYHTIQRIPTTKGIHSLGVWLAPNGNDNDELQYQIQQAMMIKQYLSKAPLRQEHTNIIFQSIWCAMLQYPLGVTCFTSQQCQRIQTKYLPTFLS